MVYKDMEHECEMNLAGKLLSLLFYSVAIRESFSASSNNGGKPVETSWQALKGVHTQSRVVLPAAFVR